MYITLHVSVSYFTWSPIDADLLTIVSLSVLQFLLCHLVSTLTDLMSSFLVSNVRVFDGESVLMSQGCVLVEDGIITSISDSVPSSLPVECKVVSGQGCTLLPGLIDAHVHVFDNVQNLADSLRYGVTTVLDMHSEPEYVKKLQEVVAQNDEVADYRSCCHAATIRGGWPEPMVKLDDKSEEVSVLPRSCQTRLIRV